MYKQPLPKALLGLVTQAAEDGTQPKPVRQPLQESTGNPNASLFILN